MMEKVLSDVVHYSNIDMPYNEKNVAWMNNNIKIFDYNKFRKNNCNNEIN